jgi:TolB-like protein
MSSARASRLALVMVCAAAPLRAQCPDGTPPPCMRSQARAPAPYSVAVLYFDNQSRDSGDAYLAAGLTEQILDRLGSVSRLTVKSRNAVRRYRDSDADPQRIGRELQVSYLASGSLRRAGDRLRVSVELTRTASGDRVWGETYDRSASNALAIEEEVAEAVATAIVGRLLPGEVRRIAARSVADPTAHDHVLRGNFFLAQRTAEATRHAISEYEAALRIQPSLAPARATLGLAYAIYATWYWPWPGLSHDSIVARGVAAATNAVSGSAPSGIAQLAYCLTRWSLHPEDVDGALACDERAVAADPGNAEVIHALGFARMAAGLDSLAEATLQQALAVDPARAITLETVARIAYRTGRLDVARRWLDSAIVVDPGFGQGYTSRARVRLRQGDVAGALADATIGAQLAPGGSGIGFVRIIALVANGQRDEAAAAMHGAEAVAADVLDTPTFGSLYIAALVALGRREDALTALGRIQPRAFELYGQLRAPDFDAIRDDPRFQRVVAEARPRVTR